MYQWRHPQHQAQEISRDPKIKRNLKLHLLHLGLIKLEINIDFEHNIFLQIFDENFNIILEDAFKFSNNIVNFNSDFVEYQNKKLNFKLLNKEKVEVIGEQRSKISSGKEIITLNHESFDRALYSEGALVAADWLMSKKAGLYSMRDLLNFK